MSAELVVVSITKHLEALRDPRIARTRWHELTDILVIALCGTICGCDSWEDLPRYGRAKVEWLQQFLRLENGIPSADTFARVFQRLDPDEFLRCLSSWVEALRTEVSQWVADYRLKRDFMLRELRSDFEIHGADGAFYLFPKAPWGTGTEFVTEAIQHNLLIIPGKVFSPSDTHFRISYAAEDRMLERGVETLYIPPGAPWENGSAESFHSRLRDEFLNAEEFDNLAHARVLSTSWRLDYNHHRPHSALDYQTPAEFAATCGGRNSAPARSTRLRSVASPTRRDCSMTPTQT